MTWSAITTGEISTATARPSPITGGTGNDFVNSLDVEVDRIDCGPGRDVAYIDNRDETKNCEKVIKRQSR